METFAPKGKVYGPILPQFVMEKPLSLGAKVMYALLCNYASEKDHCWPSHNTLATKLSCSLTSVKTYLKELVTAKLIEIRRAQYRSSVYYMINPDATFAQEPENARNLLNSDYPEPDFDCPEPDSDHLNNLNKQSNEEEIPPIPPARPDQPKAHPVSHAPSAGGAFHFDSDFEKAWSLFPKKDARGFALIAWQKLSRSGQLPALGEILSAITRFAASESWQRESGRYIPQMGNWLRGQRWLDPLSPTEEKEEQRRRELNQSLQAQEEHEKLIREQRNAEKEKIRPLFDRFSTKFSEPCHEGLYAMAFGTWMYLHSKNIAPLATDVPPHNALGIMDFMKSFQRKHQEAEYRAKQINSQELPAASCRRKPDSYGAIQKRLQISPRPMLEPGALQLAV